MPQRHGISHRPDGKAADGLVLTLACTTAADALFNYRMYMPQRPELFPIALMGFSHVLRLVLAGRRCLCPEWLGELLIVHHHWQHSFFCACSCSKVPITPMEFSHDLRLCLQGGGVYISSGTVSFSSCTITGNIANLVRAHAQNFPSPRWDFHMFCACACRAAVCPSAVAR